MEFIKYIGAPDWVLLKEVIIIGNCVVVLMPERILPAAPMKTKPSVYYRVVYSTTSSRQLLLYQLERSVPVEQDSKGEQV